MPLKIYYYFPSGSFQKMTNYTVPVSPNQICSSEQSTPRTSTVCCPSRHKSSTSPVPADWRCIADLMSATQEVKHCYWKKFAKEIRYGPVPKLMAENWPRWDLDWRQLWGLWPPFFWLIGLRGLETSGINHLVT